MADEQAPKNSDAKDHWDKAAIVLQPVGGLLTAIALALLGFYGSRVVERQQTMDSNYRLYSELMSKREESESALRKDMFQSIIQSFLKPGTQTLEARVLNLELLAYNFHEALNLKPLFLHLEKEIQQVQNPAMLQDYLGRLQRVAREVTRKQMQVLEEAGKKFERRIDLDSLKRNPGGIPLEEDSLTVDEVKRSFRVFALEADPMTKNIKVRLEVRRLNATSPEDVEANEVEFWVSFFDFTMIDNTRLSHDQRCAIVLTNYEDESAEVSVLEFPGSHASLKEKPYFQDIIQNLWKHKAGSE